jgi:nucleoside-diphosphate kinase
VANTLGIIKPDAVRRKLAGEIISKIENAGLILRGMKVRKLSKEEAQQFYAVHENKPFYNSLVDFMTSGPIIVMVLGGHGSIEHWRELMGATDPAKAKYNTIRREFGTSVEKNVVHGSDSPGTASSEVAFFFNEDEILPKGL